MNFSLNCALTTEIFKKFRYILIVLNHVSRARKQFFWFYIWFDTTDSKPTKSDCVWHDRIPDGLKRESAYELAHQTGASPALCSMKRLGIFLLPVDGMMN